MKTETWYCWRELKQFAGETEPRFVVPFSDTSKYEYTFDLLFKTADEAKQSLKTYSVEEDAKAQGWVLCLMTISEAPNLRMQIAMLVEEFMLSHSKWVESKPGEEVNTNGAAFMKTWESVIQKLLDLHK